MELIEGRRQSRACFSVLSSDLARTAAGHARGHHRHLYPAAGAKLLTTPSEPPAIRPHGPYCFAVIIDPSRLVMTKS